MSFVNYEYKEWQTLFEDSVENKYFGYWYKEVFHKGYCVGSLVITNHSGDYIINISAKKLAILYLDMYVEDTVFDDLDSAKIHLDSFIIRLNKLKVFL